MWNHLKECGGDYQIHFALNISFQMITQIYIWI